MNEVLVGVPVRLLLPVVVINLLLVVIALVDCLRSEKTYGPKWMWALIILFVNLLGPVLYFVIGRREGR